MKVRIEVKIDEDGWFVVTSRSFAGCISQGKTEREAIRNFKEALKLHLGSLSEDGLPVSGSGRVKEKIVQIPL